MRRVWAWLGTLLLLAVAARLGAPRVIRAYWQKQESNAVLRGAAIATRAGCFSCHGPQGTRGLPDPGNGQTVPTWDGGMPMMYVSGEEEVREYILDGLSKRRAASVSAAAERPHDRAIGPALAVTRSPPVAISTNIVYMT